MNEDDVEVKMRAQMRMLQTGGLTFDGGTPRRVTMAELEAQERVKLRAERVEVDLQAAENQGHEKAVLRAISKKGAAAMLANSKKQAAKAKVKAYWLDWQKRPNMYKSKAQFAKEMLRQFQDLESQQVITYRWCKEFEKEKNTTLPAQ